MNRLFTNFRVGVVVLLGAVAFAVLVSFLGKQRFRDKDIYHVYANFADASGLSAKSRVQIAGIEVGVVERIELTDDAKAHVTLRVRKDIKLHTDGRITKRSASLLGDFVLDIYPGTPAAPLMADGDTFLKAVAQPGVDDVFAALGDVTRDIQGVTSSLKGLLDSDGPGSIKEIIRSMNAVALGLNETVKQAGGRLDSILDDVKALTTSVRALADNQTGNVGEILDNIRLFTEQADKVVVAVNGILGTGGDDLRQSVVGVKETLQQLKKTLADADAMVGSVKGTVDDAHKLVDGVSRGDGTLGKLVHDDAIANNIEHALGDVHSLLSPLSSIHLHAQLMGELHYRPGLTGDYNRPWLKGGVALQLQTSPDFYYGAEAISEPRGSTSQQVTAVSGSDVPVTTTVTTDAWKYSLYVAKRIGPVAFRAGVIESTGGVGMDGFLANDHVRLSLDAFDFTDVNATYPRLRAQARFSFLTHLFLGLGVDDILNTKPVLQAGRFLVGTDGFVSGGVTFTDDDMVTALGALGLKKAQ